MLFRPSHDFDTFREEIIHSDQEFVEYFPQEAKEYFKNFVQANKIITCTYLALNISFVAFCHKIKFLNKILGEKSWKMFIFKIAMLGGPYYLYNQTSQQAEDQAFNKTYDMVQKNYRKYIRSGDIKDFNPNVQIVGFGINEIDSILNQIRQNKMQEL